MSSLIASLCSAVDDTGIEVNDLFIAFAALFVVHAYFFARRRAVRPGNPLLRWERISHRCVEAAMLAVLVLVFASDFCWRP